ncbi:hypothetical protein BC739_001531 [Kutzneria viridogrisea]|uniref:Uncharacterized protein n=1 Tax=Kutzneria viridogrisea TaxID=47990 RepID=A0ABR6BBT3_9PSEU|nr:hypothetical protein [Kutzneria viridogrisea]
MARRAGLVEVARLLREPEEHEAGPQGFLLARKPQRSVECGA